MNDPAHPNGTAKWQLFASLATVAVALIAAFIGLLLTINSQGNAVTSLTERVNSAESRLASMTDTVNRHRETLAELRNSLVEIETQFRAEDAMRNLMHANELRNTAMLWQKVFGVDYPTANAYYPAIGRNEAVK